MRISTAIAVILLCQGWTAAAQAPDAMMQALEFYRHRDCKQAEPLFEQMLDKQPKNVALRKLYASCLAQTGHTDQAKIQYKIVLTTSPRDREALEALRPPAIRVESSPGVPAPAVAARTPQFDSEFEQAGVLIRQKRLGEAEALLVRMVSRSPRAVPPRQRLAEIYTATRRFEKAAGEYMALAKAAGDRPAFTLHAAQNFAWAKKYDEAVDSYRVYLEAAPRDLEARLALANVLMWSGKLPQAADEFLAYLAKRPADTNARIGLANVLLWTKRYADAAEEFKRILASKPAEERAQVGLAQCYERMGQPTLALKAYDRALEIQPDNTALAEAKLKLQAELPRQKAYAAMERQDNAAAARDLLEYLQQHPESNETVLQIARLYSWSKKYREAITFYSQYLALKPEDKTALRELAKTELSVPDFENARRHYTLLIRGEDATAADYEGLIHAFLWDGKVEGAQAVARKLAGIEPENKVARAAIQDYTEKQKSALLAEARELTSQRRYAEAIDRYGEYQQIYGSSGEIELMVARLNSWDKKLGAAETAYHNYLLKHPADVDARLELANVQRWIGHYGLAELSYREVLKSDPRNSGALLGLAQVADSRSADPFALVQAYRQVLAADPKNMAARNRMDQLEPLVSPSMGYSFHSFGDSDGYYRGENRFQFSLPLPGNLQLSPYYSLTYFHQYRQVGGGNCAAENPNLDARTVGLSSAICGRNGTYWGNGGGVQTRLGAVSGTNLLLDIGATRFSTGPVSLNARADLTVKLSPGSLLFLDLARRPGVWDLNTVGTLAAGIVGDTGLLGFQTNIGERWRFWAAGGVTRYSAGIGRAYGNNIQRRFSTRLDYSVLPSLRAGYVIRVSTFDKASPYYFSPSRYLTYGVTYSWTQPLSPHVRLDVDGEGGLGQIKRFGVARLDTLEMAAQPNIVWTIYPGLDFHLGYRFSRGRSSAFGSPVYSTGGMEFGLVKSLGERYAPADPTRLDIY